MYMLFIWFSDKCKECCLKDDDYDVSGFKRYPKAILKVCTCKFGAYPQIQGTQYIFYKNI